MEMRFFVIRNKNNCMPKQIINTSEAPQPIGPYNQSIKAGGFLFVSGQIPIDPVTGNLIAGGIIAETHQVMRNLKVILAEAKLTFGHVVKTTIFLSDMSLFADVNEVYGSYFSGDYPARECVAVKTLPKNVAVEISVIAAVSL
jgi:2-iminobutanoate/2-iminopropanoate deaminase